MKYWYQALSAPTADTPGSTFILCYPNRKYVFGHASEGLQRTFTERSQSFTNLTEFFITGKTGWDNIGGLLGMLLTIADARANSATSLALDREEKRVRQQQHANAAPPNKSGSEEVSEDRSETVTIHGGKNITHTFGTARRFIFRKKTPIRVKEYESDFLVSDENKADPFEKPTWSDENINVWAIPLQSVLDYSKSFKSTAFPRFGSKSPLKRSLDDFEEVQSTTLDPAVKDRMLRDAIVKDMFESKWRIDTLHEIKLADIKKHPGAIFVRNPVTKDIEKYDGPLPGGSEPIPDINVLVRKPWPGALIERLPHTTPAVESLCYVVRGHDQRGKFDREKAIALGVPTGPAFAALAKGENYTNEEGKVITPDMVLGPSRPGRGVAFVEIPSSDFIENFISRAEWNSPAVTSSLSVFVWILGPNIGEDQRIRNFISNMSHCKHVMSSTDYCPNQIAMQTAAKSALRLASINKDNFIVPYHDNITLPQPGTSPEGSSIRSKNPPWIPSQPGLVLDIEPDFKINRSEVVTTFNPLHHISRMPRAVQQRLEKIQKQLQKPYFIDKIMDMRYSISDVAGETEVFTLGTGSSSPSKYRNVSATLLHVPEKGYYLLDAGENTLGQLKRMFNPEQLHHVMKNLRMIWISHLHADHHLGTASVIKEWYKVNRTVDSSIGSSVMKGEITLTEMLQKKRLCVLGEVSFIQWLEEYAGVEDYGFGAILPLSVHPKEKLMTGFSYRHCRADGSYPEDGPASTNLSFEGEGSSEYSKLLQEATGLAKLSAVWVNHCKGSMAVSFTWDHKLKVSYSGDCRPSSEFAQIGQGSTLLIHEATFQDDMAGSAIAKKHSTTSEAIRVGRRMNARMTLLTHFSQRYAKISKAGSESNNSFQKPERTFAVPRHLDVADSEDLPIDEPAMGGPGDLSTADDYEMPVCIAYDYMKVKIRDIPIAQMFSPAFEKLVQRIDQAAVEDEEKKKAADELSRQLNKEKKKASESRKKAFARKSKEKADKEKTPSPEPTKPAESVETTEARKPSAWSASESESGWSASESENEDVASK